MSEQLPIISREDHQTYQSVDIDNRNQKNDGLQSTDIIETTANGYGRWQLKIIILMVLIKIPVNWFELGIIFLGPPTDFWCKTPQSYFRKFYNVTSNSCVLSQINGTQTVPCDWGFYYDRSVIHSSIVTEWNLVCSNAYLVNLSQMALMLGVFLGSTTLGIVSDRYGRKKTIIFSILLETIASGVMLVVPWFSIFMCSRLLLGFATGGCTSISLVMCIECTRSSQRPLTVAMFQSAPGFSLMLMSGLAYLFRDWKQLQLAFTIINIFYISYAYFVNESPRWLAVQGKRDEAVKVLQLIAKSNGIKTDPDAIIKKVKEIEPPVKKVNITTLLSASTIRKQTFFLSMNNFLFGVAFFGFSQYVGQVSDNIYIGVAISGAAFTPGSFLTIFLFKCYGRRKIVIFSTVTTAVWVTALFLINQNWIKLIFLVLSCLNMSISMSAFLVLMGELYPTVLRNAGVGLCMTFGRLGGILAPLILTQNMVSPLLILAVVEVMECILVLPLPETRNRKLPETLADVEN